MERLNLLSRVTFLGYVEPERVQALYQSASVFVFPTYYDEGFPTVIAEAMSAGLPIVTCRTRGIADHLVEGRHALFVPPQQPAILFETVAGLLSDPDLMDRMSAANRKRIKRFEPDRVGREYLQALMRIANVRP